MSKNIAIITARGGSKRIPRKNIKHFLGKPIISYSIETAIQSGLFTHVMVSTDDSEIEEVARKFKAEVPFKRSQKNSDDFATTADVICEVLSKYENESFDNFCCIYPTAPLVTSELLKVTYDAFKSEKADIAYPICKFGYPPQRAVRLNHSRVEFIDQRNITTRSQDLEPIYHDAGQFYWGNVKSFLEKKSLVTDNTYGHVIDELQTQDIDNEVDWKLAELKYKLLTEKMRSL